MAATRLIFVEEKQPSAFKTTQEGTNMDVSDSPIKNSDPGNRMAGDMEGGPEPWVPARFGSFCALKRNSPPKSVGHKNRHSSRIEQQGILKFESPGHPEKPSE
jgi:hypothetical protein